MIVTGDVMTILCRDSEELGISEIYRSWKVPDGVITTEKVLVFAKEQVSGTYWKTGVAEIHICVPDVDGTAGVDRLTVLEREAVNLFVKADVYDGTAYCYSVQSVVQEENSALKCHQVNCKLLFETLNC